MTSLQHEPSARLRLVYFDGRSARAQSAEIWLEQGLLHVLVAANDGAPSQRQYPCKAIQWPERQRHGERQVQLPDGGLLSCAESQAWDSWAQSSGLLDSALVRWMQSWRRVGLSLLLLLALLTSAWRWGIPLATQATMTLLPAAVEQDLGGRALAYFDRHLLQASRLDAAKQLELSQRFERLLAASPADLQAPYRLHFRQANKAFGPNAFALPGGDIVMTDALVELMADEPNAVLGVLAHELGHVRHRHGLRMTIQASMAAALAGLIVGDYSALLAGLPALLAQQSYSRDFERQADEHARSLLRKAGISPKVMLPFFERLEKMQGLDDELSIAFSSHPANEERRRFFAQ
ncbi:M48 family metallopeptidase [Roseateles oligotrophus]|uniref:M48 family metallopeptidase n=1 Tax=Roseateles oligotrophus TaxID=1769250 RepID=A0ABT2YJQ8_9BURK|nr:M48 family metallopeptidase [Roseateles oligotrophus]MCV2370294.1 M48 family metallopeptidase [Roseateles oligotrophus]